MKIALVLFAVLALGYSAPQPRKVFHEHFQDFVDVIIEEARSDLDHLVEHYMQFEELWVSVEYMRTNDFKNLVYEMESLPEFKAVVDFLENDNIDIRFFIDILNDLLETIPRTRNEVSGKDMSSFIKDAIAVFPKAKLQALYDEKMAEDDEFRVAIENLQSDEWDRIWSALWENDTFLSETQTLLENGIDLGVLVDEIIAVFGLN